MNQTEYEKEKNLMRPYNDKIRKYTAGQLFYIFQNYDREKFYDRQRTFKKKH